METSLLLSCQCCITLQLRTQTHVHNFVNQLLWQDGDHMLIKAFVNLQGLDQGSMTLCTLELEDDV